MLERTLVLALGVIALGALGWSAGAAAKLAGNGASLNGSTSNAVGVQAVRLILPDGTVLQFR